MIELINVAIRVTQAANRLAYNAYEYNIKVAYESHNDPHEAAELYREVDALTTEILSGSVVKNFSDTELNTAWLEAA